MLSGIIYSFVHGCKTFNLFTFNNPEQYVASLNGYDSEKDCFFYASLDSELFCDKTVDYIDQHIVEWYEKAEKKPYINETY